MRKQGCQGYKLNGRRESLKVGFGGSEVDLVSLNAGKPVD